jgi:hypothetical protein
MKIREYVFNILMLGVVYEGVAFPLVWCLLEKRGLNGHRGAGFDGGATEEMANQQAQSGDHR